AKLKKEIEETKDGEEENVKEKELKISYEKIKRKIGETNEHAYTIIGIITNYGGKRETNKKIELEIKSNDDDRTLLHGIIILLMTIEENTTINMNMTDRIGRIIKNFNNNTSSRKRIDNKYYSEMIWLEKY